MPLSDSVHYSTISELAPLIKAGEISPVELTEAMLKRVHALNPRLRAYEVVTEELALKQARQAEAEIAAGSYRGELHGIPLAVKDLCFTRGIVSKGGSAVNRDNVPSFDATVVSKLADAGAVLLGKVVMTEGAMGGYNPALAYAENPWRESHWPGSSSSGSGSATAAGMAFAALGSDTGGSIRHPAAVCGTVGLKPTWGRVSRYGVMDLAPSLDHVGPLTRSARDAGLVLQAISGHEVNDPTTLLDEVPDMVGGASVGVRGLRIGYDERYTTEDMEPSFARAVVRGVEVLAKLGAEIVPVKMPERLREYMTAWPVICGAEAAVAHAATYPSRANEYGPWFREWLRRGSSYSAIDYAKAHELRLLCNGELRNTMRGVDLMACPATAKAAYKVTPEEMYGPIPADRDPWASRFTVPHDYAGLPTITLPAGLTGDGLPASLQLVGHHLSEPLLVQAGCAFEAATDHHKLHPPL
jgi:amidase